MAFAVRVLFNRKGRLWKIEIAGRIISASRLTSGHNGNKILRLSSRQ